MKFKIKMSILFLCMGVSIFGMDEFIEQLSVDLDIVIEEKTGRIVPSSASDYLRDSLMLLQQSEQHYFLYKLIVQLVDASIDEQNQVFSLLPQTLIKKLLHENILDLAYDLDLVYENSLLFDVVVEPSHYLMLSENAQAFVETYCVAPDENENPRIAFLQALEDDNAFLQHDIIQKNKTDKDLFYNEQYKLIRAAVQHEQIQSAIRHTSVAEEQAIMSPISPTLLKFWDIYDKKKGSLAKKAALNITYSSI